MDVNISLVPNTNAFTHTADGTFVIAPSAFYWHYVVMWYCIFSVSMFEDSYYMQLIIFVFVDQSSDMEKDEFSQHTHVVCTANESFTFFYVFVFIENLRSLSLGLKCHGDSYQT